MRLFMIDQRPVAHTLEGEGICLPLQSDYQHIAAARVAGNLQDRASRYPAVYSQRAVGLDDDRRPALLPEAEAFDRRICGDRQPAAARLT